MDETLFHVINNISASGKSATDRFRIFCKYYSVIYYDGGREGKYREEEKFLIDLIKESFPEWLEWILHFPNLYSERAKVMGRQTFNPQLLKKLMTLNAYQREDIRTIVGIWIDDLIRHKNAGHDVNFIYPAYNPALQTNLGRVRDFGIPSSLWLVNLFAPRTGYSIHPYIDNAKKFIL